MSRLRVDGEKAVTQPADTSSLSAEEIWHRGLLHYERALKHKLEPAYDGQFVVINVTNGDFFVDPDEDRAIDAAQARYPEEVFYIGRVGADTAHRIGRHARRG
jgi:hypothetical protein